MEDQKNEENNSSNPELNQETSANKSSLLKVPNGKNSTFFET